VVLARTFDDESGERSTLGAVDCPQPISSTVLNSITDTIRVGRFVFIVVQAVFRKGYLVRSYVKSTIRSVVEAPAGECVIVKSIKCTTAREGLASCE